MNGIITTDQNLCINILQAANMLEALVPKPPNNACDGIMQFDPFWIVATNDHGFYTLHIIENATKEEAWGFFDDWRKSRPGYIQAGPPRLAYPSHTKLDPTKN